ncbi:MAG: tetratricopeptide repeat protein, partial [Verrucomicrobiia bacterium]
MDGSTPSHQTSPRALLRFALLLTLATNLGTAEAQIFGGRKAGRTGDDPAAAFAAAETLASQGETSAAISAYKTLAKRNPRSEFAPRALTRAAQLQEQSRDLMGAYRTLDDLVSKYPKSPEI